jgi:hypothetical protein
VPQPAYDPQKPHLAYPLEAYKQMIAAPDAAIAAASNYAEPPVKKKA